MRAIVFLLFVILVFFIIRFTLNRVIQIREQNRKSSGDATETTKEKMAEAMVRCALCGIHLPQSDAYYDGKDTFCSEGHMHEFHNEKQANSADD